MGKVYTRLLTYGQLIMSFYFMTRKMSDSTGFELGFLLMTEYAE